MLHFVAFELNTLIVDRDKNILLKYYQDSKINTTQFYIEGFATYLTITITKMIEPAEQINFLDSNFLSGKIIFLCIIFVDLNTFHDKIGLVD